MSVAAFWSGRLASARVGARRAAAGAVGGLGSLSEDWLFERISVRRPYFAAEAVSSGGPGRVSATLPNWSPGPGEGPGIGIADSGQHLAVIGSCAVATCFDGARPRRLYVLARQARLRRLVVGPSEVAPRDELQLEASAQVTSRRAASALTTLRSSAGTALLEAEIDYHLVPQRTLDRHLARLGRPMPRRLRRRSRDHALAPQGSRSSSTVLGRVAEADCEGHFPGRPLLSVAHLSGYLAEVNHALLNRLAATDEVDAAGAPRAWQFVDGLLSAERLVPAGTSLALEATWEPEAGAAPPGVETDAAESLFRVRSWATDRSTGEVVARADVRWQELPTASVQGAA